MFEFCGVINFTEIHYKLHRNTFLNWTFLPLAYTQNLKLCMYASRLWVEC